MIKFSEISEHVSDQLLPIVKKIQNKERISNKEALTIFSVAPLSLLGMMANNIREDLHGIKTYFNKNIHIEPTNICVFDCKFCSYSRLLSKKEEAWEFSKEEMIQQIIDHDDKEITEVHIVGGVHPKMGLEYFASLIKQIKKS